MTTTKTKAKESGVPTTTPAQVALSVPLLDHGSVDRTRLDTRLTPRQARALRLVTAGLVAAKETQGLVGGSREPVTQETDAIRWLLDKIADAAV